MGVVKRQGIKQSIVNYAGVFLAFFSTIFVYSLNTELYGAARFIIDTAFIISPFILLGAGSVSIKYFPIFKNVDKKHHGLLGLLILQSLFGGFIVLGLLFLFKDQIMGLYDDKPALYTAQFFKIGILAMLVALFNLLYSYSTNFKRIVVPSIFLSLIKVSLPILVLLFYFKYVSFSFLANGILATYLVALLGMIAYLAHLGHLFLKPSFELMDNAMTRQMSVFAIFSLLSGMGSTLAFRIDSFMVGTLIDMENNGVYNIALFIGNAIAIPTAAIIQIASPLVSESLKNNKLGEVKTLYSKSSLNLLIFGVLLFTLVMASIVDLFGLMPGKDFDIYSGYYIVMTIGLAKLVDMATSINSQIIIYSKYYRFNVVAILLMALINIMLNLVLIPKFQVIGAAMSTFLSLTIYNLIKLGFIYFRFKIQPFSLATLSVLILGALGFGLSLLIPDTGNHILNIILKSAVVGAAYTVCILKLKVSEDVNELWRDAVKLVSWLVG